MIDPAEGRKPNPEQTEGAGNLPGAEDAPVVLPIEETLDLHTFSPRDIPSVVNAYLEECAHRGFPEVRLIHGRGTGTQRAIVQSLLACHPLVQAFADAPPERGGWGATVVRIRGTQPQG